MRESQNIRDPARQWISHFTNQLYWFNEQTLLDRGRGLITLTFHPLSPESPQWARVGRCLHNRRRACLLRGQ